MALENRRQLYEVLARADGLGRVFARHAYGMGRWVDLFAARIPPEPEPESKELLARLVADNARHVLLFRDRACAGAVDPDAYACPPEGEAIYARIAQLELGEAIGYALGSLDHFAELLGVYADTARSAAATPAGPRHAGAEADARTVAEVRADVDDMRAALRGRAGPVALVFAAEAHEHYRVRELAETPLYADAV